jgi:hypothetical protein
VTEVSRSGRELLRCVGEDLESGREPHTLRQLALGKARRVPEVVQQDVEREGELRLCVVQSWTVRHGDACCKVSHGNGRHHREDVVEGRRPAHAAMPLVRNHERAAASSAKVFN